MKNIISYNVNGVRAAHRKGFLDWIKSEDPDIVCLQESKAQPDQLDEELRNPEGYHSYWYSAEKKGYSGVAILTKEEPKHVEYGCGIEAYDKEGRVVRADFENFSIISAYFPSGSSGSVRQEIKEAFLDDFFVYIEELKKKLPNLIISGDYNICHQAIDIHDPVRNKKVSGFLPVEREWIGNFMKSGFIDSFRHLNKEPHNYTWWSYRANARNNNKGWRLDYGMVSEPLENRLKRSVILSDAKHSDHCPILVELG